MAKLQHVHKWFTERDRGGADCKCGAFMNDAQLCSYLNAVEKFPIQDAIQVLWDLEHAAGLALGPEYEALEDYISELEP